MRPVNMTIVQGTPFQFLVQLKHKDEAGDFVPLPLSGYTAKLQARQQVDSLAVLLEMSSEDNRILIDEEEGTLTLRLTQEETSALVWGVPNVPAKAVYQCEVTPPDGDTMRVLKGTLTLDPQVIR